MSDSKPQDTIDTKNPEFQKLRNLINYSNSSIFLTGKAGTGKSTFLRYIIQHTRKNYVVLAPTGIAAVNVGGVTLHSFFSIPFKPLLPDDPEFAIRNLRRRLKLSKAKQKLIKKLELVVIDEISMVRADIIDFIDKVLRVYSGNMRKPFGGKQLLLVGDMFQLEPVVTADMRELLRPYYSNQYFFSANVFRMMGLVSIELQKVYRQTDSEFISLLDRIRAGKPTKGDIEALNRRVVPPDTIDFDPSTMRMTLGARRSTVDFINESCLDRLTTPEVVYTGERSGDFPDNSLPTPIELKLKEGAQVVFIRNDMEHRWVNGTIGRVVTAEPDILEVELEDGTIHLVEPEIWENITYSLDKETGKIAEKVVGTYRQYPLRLAWALTIHKSQGLTFNHVDIDLGQGAFSSGQTYVALSRCRSFDGLRLQSTIDMRDVFINPAILSFSRTFNDDGVINEALRFAEADNNYHLASEAAARMELTEAVDRFVAAHRVIPTLGSDSAWRLIRRKMLDVEHRLSYVDQLEAEIKGLKKQLSELAKEYISMGYDCMEDGYDPLPALNNFEKALRLDPDNTRALEGKASALEAMGDTKGANKIRKSLKRRK